jgi:hypothetical protein
MRIGQMELDPARNPGVLNTATWDRAAAWVDVQAAGERLWQAISTGSAANEPPVTGAAVDDDIHLYPAAFARHDGAAYALAHLPDGQDVFLRVGPAGEDGLLGEPAGYRRLAGDDEIVMYPADAPVIDRFIRMFKPEAGPRALGPVPRLGVGTRMTTAVWPAIWEAMRQTGVATNAIQNSVRELNLLETLLSGLPPETNTAFGFGTIETGYTGSTFEGLWVSGVLDALKAGVHQPYGADADHIQVKRGPQGLARAKRLLDATRYYSFYTLDVSDVLDYAALDETLTAAAEARLAASIRDAAEQAAVEAYHTGGHELGGYDYRPDRAALGRLAGKYWAALAAVDELYRYLLEVKGCVPFDLELSIDEHPNEIPAFDCLTSETELCFVLLEAQRRGIPLTHVAPNFGVEKGTDYRCPDGLPGLAARCRSLSQIAEACGVMPDFHSGDDLGPATRRIIGQATGGRNHFKVSPMLQLIFGEVLAEHHPELFRRWWEDALAYAQRAAAGGSDFAADCLRQDDEENRLVPSAHGQVFHHFSFAFVGRRDANGTFLNREAFYTLSPAFYEAYQARVVQYLVELAGDLF